MWTFAAKVGCTEGSQKMGFWSSNAPLLVALMAIAELSFFTTLTRQQGPSKALLPNSVIR